MSLSAVLLLVISGVGMNQKAAKFACLIFQGSEGWVGFSNPCFPSLRGYESQEEKIAEVSDLRLILQHGQKKKASFSSCLELKNICSGSP